MRRTDDVDMMKYQVASELGLLQKLLNVGWAGLSPEESGRIGGIISGRRRRG